ncbi:LOW QUALITY PROTEIN: myosin heavy chain, embryonic smooth muscle isoform-like [Pomacea canaliculata]|uniref:LOW QUALITY PROTEIN: myosin heavy chain, embryonic smooth muscle isoform-like n=1 Tax=Pomacea canaliculata TaxID=400727 RepID=UPI000D730943|nr:LOW QUALITY PROTEIN: myosin heavy chain, embryonic smooth muscle isoform-like [Pomacea canaliculata]
MSVEGGGRKESVSGRQQQARELEDLEDELQAAEDAKLRLEVNMHALKAQYDRDVAGLEELEEESKRSLLKQLREMEEELQDELKHDRAIAVNARNKLQGYLRGLEQEVEIANKVKEDDVKQYQKLAAQMKDFQHEVEKARIALKEMAAAVKDNEKRVKNLEAERSVSLKLENQRLVLERQDKEMRDKLQELEGQN